MPHVIRHRDSWGIGICDEPEESRRRLWLTFFSSILITGVPLGLLMAIGWWLSG